jgi:prephenate dehydrogenase
MSSKKPQIGIIGYGDFSKLLVRHLNPVAEVVVSTRQHLSGQPSHVKFVSEDVVLAQPIIIPSLPAQSLEGYFEKRKGKVNPNSLIIDVCSVKMKPVEVLQRVLPSSVKILATHPMFGPTSAKDGLKGQRIMMYPVRLSDQKYQQIKEFITSNFGLQIIECTPQEHDKAMAYVQGLSHYIGRVMQEMDIPQTELLTNAYTDLLDMKRIQGNDSWDLFESIMHENPFTAQVHEQFIKACQNLDLKIGFKK